MKKRTKKSRMSVRVEIVKTRYVASRDSTGAEPKITLKGRWLTKLGFKEGQRVVIQTSDELIIIRPEKRIEEELPQKPN